MVLLTVLLSVSYGAMLGTGIPDKPWTSLEGGATVWVILVFGAILVSLDAWYNFILIFGRLQFQRSQGIPVAGLVLSLLIISFLPFQLMTRFYDQAILWKALVPQTAFLLNMVAVFVLDGIFKITVGTEIAKLEHRLTDRAKVLLIGQGVYRVVAACVFMVIYVSIFDGVTPKDDAVVPLTLVLVGMYFVARLSEHLIGVKIVIPKVLDVRYNEDGSKAPAERPDRNDDDSKLAIEEA